MIIFHIRSGEPRVIRPCPLINIGFTASSSANLTTGGVYNITLNGTLIANEGSPDAGGVLAQYTPRPTAQNVENDSRLRNILKKQKHIQDILDDINYIEVLGIDGDQDGLIKFYPRLVSVSFDEGVWIDTCSYSIVLETDVLLDDDDKIIGSNHYANKMFGIAPQGKSISDYISEYGGFVSDFSENWSLEPEDGNAYIPNGSVTGKIFRTYILTRTISATGKRFDDNDGTLSRPAHIHAKNFIEKYIERQSGSGATDESRAYLKYAVDQKYGNSNLSQKFGEKFINLAQANFKGYNHARSETFDVSNGSYSINDKWILSRENCYEDYTASYSSSLEDNLRSVTISGRIKGLSAEHAKSPIYGGDDGDANATAYANAVAKYNTISSNGQYGVGCDLFKRAQSLMTGLQLNPVPNSTSLSFNELIGELSYTIEYNNRPIVTDIDGIVSSLVSITDTYPGDVFAVLPVIGRVTGPVMQYLGTRTEYRRELALEFTIDMARYNGLGTTPPPSPSDPYNLTTTSTTSSTTLNPATARERFIRSKPTLWNPARTEIFNIVRAASPAFEPGIRKYFLNPPTETWNPLDGKYTLNMSWVYELNG